MTDANPRRRGGQIGNQNARKHGFYSQMRTRKENHLLPFALAEDINHDIAVMRVTISSTLRNDPDNARLRLYAESVLQQMLRTKRLLQRRRREKARRDAEKPRRLLSTNPKTEHAESLSITPNTIQAQTRDSSLELHPRFSPGPVVFACPSPKDEGRHGDSKQSAPPCAKISVF